MKVLITGAAGFVGRHLAADLKRAGHVVVETGLEAAKDRQLGSFLHLDITSLDECVNVIEREKPDAVVHLAGLAHTNNNDKNPDLLYRVNVAGSANISSAVGTLARSDRSHHRQLLFVSSAFVYGGGFSAERLECDEKTPTSPRTKYGESKLLAEASVRFFEDVNYQIYIARPFNHIGPRQDSTFVVPGFVKRILTAENGSSIETGDLTAYRDFTDVRDVVRGYRLILEKRPRERLFVFGSGKSVSIQTIFDQIVDISGKRVTAKIAPSLLRSERNVDIFANPSLAHQVLGWTPVISLKECLQTVWQEYAAEL